MDRLMAGERQESRIEWIDTAKGLGIILVVVGHVLRGLTTAQVMGPGGAARFLDGWIYSFHMPLFFFLSGLFLFQSATKSSLRVFILGKLRLIAYPYVIWSIITVLLKAELGTIPNTPRGLSDLLLIPFSPIEQFWFLYVLLVLVVTFGTIFAFGYKPWLAIAIALMIYPTVFAETPGWSVLYMLRTYAIFVAIGAFVGTTYLRQFSTASSVLLCLAAMIGLIFPVVDIATSQQTNNLLCALSGIIGISALSLLLCRTKFASFLSFIGALSLEIFVGHTMASGGARTVLEWLQVRSPEIHIVVGIAAGIFLPIVLWRVCELSGFRFGFTFPKPPVARRPSMVLPP
jgi:fucose 4-O-acetylase-like acetyltransferase